MKSIVATLIAMFFLASCQHTPPLTLEGERCEIVRYSLESPLPDERPLESILGENPGEMLLLSGGSQNGAFGAGFLDGWQSTGQMPQFRLVTGISTGALQATGAFIGRPEITVEGYSIDSEGDLLDAFVDGSAVNDGLSLGATITALRKGAISDLVPLRSRLDRLLTPDVLEAVAARYDPEGDGAYLLAGATDVDLGQAVAFDLTELASRYAGAPASSDERARLKHCYIEALIASSVVPPAARPVFIDNRMYIDGGVRNAVFDDRIAGMLADAMAVAPPTEAVAPSLTIILNGTGEPKAECGKVDEANCVPLSSTVGQLEDYDLLGLAFRTVDLLANQVERVSIERATERARNLSAPTFFARIRAGDLTDDEMRYAIPDFTGEKTCEAWLADDDADENPLQFHRRYMRCLIEYGRERGTQMDWDFAPQG